MKLYNGVSETWVFNTLRQPTSLMAAAGGTTLMTLGWTYNSGANNGNVTGHTIQRSSGLAASLTESYSYVDPANRLSSATEAGSASPTPPNQTYLYDAFGNRAVQAGSWVPNPALTPQSVTEFTKNQWKGSTGNHGYDGAGNQTQLANGTGAFGVFTYDGENRLLTANLYNEGTVTFAYDGEGRRVQKTSALGTTTYVHDAMGNLAAEYSTQAPTATGTEYLTADTLGSTRLVTDGSGNPVRCIDYLPFGEEIPSGQNGRTGCYEGLGSPQYPVAPDVESVKFTGKERDAETGLDYFGARYFSGAQGRWTTPDWSPIPQPIPYADLSDPQTLNLYSYLRNNPLSRTDPDGHGDVLDFLLGAANAWSSNNLLGAGRQEQTSSAGKAGAALGDAVSTAQGVGEMIIGGGGEVLGLALDATGVGSIVGVPINVAAAGLAAHGVGTTIQGGVHMAQDVNSSSSGETLSRLGTDRESAGRLGRKAAEAEGKIGIHGVSTTAGEPGGPASSAPRAGVEPHFPVHDTPTRSDPQHRTVELPKPVTQKVADLFNKIFGR